MTPTDPKPETDEARRLAGKIRAYCYAAGHGVGGYAVCVSCLTTAFRQRDDQWVEALFPDPSDLGRTLGDSPSWIERAKLILAAGRGVREGEKREAEARVRAKDGELIAALSERDQLREEVEGMTQTAQHWKDETEKAREQVAALDEIRGAAHDFAAAHESAQARLLAEAEGLLSRERDKHSTVCGCRICAFLAPEQPAAVTPSSWKSCPEHGPHCAGEGCCCADKHVPAHCPSCGHVLVAGEGICNRCSAEPGKVLAAEVSALAKRLRETQKDLDPQAARVLRENLWELYDSAQPYRSEERHAFLPCPGRSPVVCCAEIDGMACFKPEGDTSHATERASAKVMREVAAKQAAFEQRIARAALSDPTREAE